MLENYFEEDAVSGVSESPQSVLGRVTLLLEPFRTAEGLTLTELAQRTGFPRSSTHRMLLQLVKVGWISRSGTTYRLGPKMIELGALARIHDRIHRAALPTLYDLQTETGLVVHLAVLDGEDLLYLEKIGGRWTSETPSHVGERRPAHTTAAGIAMLHHRDGSYAPATEADAFLVSGGVVRGGNPVRSVAAAFEAGNGDIGAIALTGPQGRLPEGVGRLVRHAADAVSARLA